MFVVNAKKCTTSQLNVGQTKDFSRSFRKKVGLSAQRCIFNIYIRHYLANSFFNFRYYIQNLDNKSRVVRINNKKRLKHSLLARKRFARGLCRLNSHAT